MKESPFLLFILPALIRIPAPIVARLNRIFRVPTARSAAYDRVGGKNFNVLSASRAFPNGQRGRSHVV
jgi:hypothetical protein